MVGNQQYFPAEYVRGPKKLIKIPAFSRTLFTSIIARNVLQGLSSSRHATTFWIVGEKREREGYNGALASMGNDFPKRGGTQSAICEIHKSAKKVLAP